VPPEGNPLNPTPPHDNEEGEGGGNTAPEPEGPGTEGTQPTGPSQEPPRVETLDEDSIAEQEPRLSDADEDLTDDGENSSYGGGSQFGPPNLQELLDLTSRNCGCPCSITNKNGEKEQAYCGQLTSLCKRHAQHRLQGRWQSPPVLPIRGG
jgi:hypothetical protein